MKKKKEIAIEFDDPERLLTVLEKLELELDLMEKSWRMPAKNMEKRKYSYEYVKKLSQAFYIKGKLSVLRSEIKFDKDFKLDYVG